MNPDGIIIGLAAFLIIGVFHPIVIKCEYYFSVKIWPLFLVLGIGLSLASLWIPYLIFRSILGITGFSCLWSIIELFHQRKRVAKGWFPANPKRRK